MNLETVVNFRQLYQEIQDGYVRVSEHPTLPLRVYCYTEKAVYEGHWTDTTRMCRGLITDNHLEIVAWCMPKFFNANEHIDGRPYAAPLPDEPFDIYAKVDGSLGTVFNYEGQWLVATKGGFGSEQAKWAQKWLGDHDLSSLDPEKTYVTEIIYPENRIVVNYASLETLILLAVFSSDGRDNRLAEPALAWEDAGGTVVRQYPKASLSRILFRAQRNQRLDGTATTGAEAEGYVLRYRSGLRVKVKFADYVRLHGVVTGLTERHVWELLREGRSLESLLAVLPDEYGGWVDVTAALLRSEFRNRARMLVESLLESSLPSDPREFAKYADTLSSPGLFPLYDTLSDLVWAGIRPEAKGPWKDHE